MLTATFENVNKILVAIRKKTTLQPIIGVICGSGLGGFANALDNRIVIPYNDIDGFPKSTVAGHKGNLVLGTIANKDIIVMQGRFHQYEGFSNNEIAIPIRLMKLLGVETLLISNAAGGLNREYKIGDFVIIKDHISFPGLSLNNVLVGPNEEKFGPRFVALSEAYDKNLRKLMKSIAIEKNVSNIIHEGVYASIGGPTYETPAECKMLISLGADVTGMSTVPEVIVAQHCGIRTFAVSLVTNSCNLETEEGASANHKEVLETANKRATILEMLFIELIKRI